VALTLYVDGERWRRHQADVRDTHPGLVPVIKGNGYGFGLPRLTEQAEWLGVDTLAVGTYPEARRLLERPDLFGGTIMVLTPWRPFEDLVTYDARVVHTVGRLEDLAALRERAAGQQEPVRVVLERLTSMLRHGFTAPGLREAAAHSEGLVVEGASVHLPIARGSHLAEVQRLMTDIVAAGLGTRRVYASHLEDHELATLRRHYPDYEFRPRIGTALWLGDRGALQVRAEVLDVHAVERGDVFGYRGRSAPRAGHIVVVSGGTAHGIGLEAPTGGSTLRDRAVRLAQGGLDAAGLVRSPFSIGGKQRLFAEPPHMQASMLFLPTRSPVPAVGDQLDVRVRFTATEVDATVLR
jgi:alanine racemase